MAKYYQEFIVEHRFGTAKDFLSAIVPWTSELELKNYIFRGHSNSNYSLTPTLLRDESLSFESQKCIWRYSRVGTMDYGSNFDNDFNLGFAEYQLIRDFYRSADARGLEVPTSERIRMGLSQEFDMSSVSLWRNNEKWLPDDFLEVAALAQHYGLPTALLDWSYDPFVAAFFASSPEKSLEGDLCVWGLNSVVVDCFQKEVVDVPKFPLKLITPHYSGNPNLAAQSGLFTHWERVLPGLNMRAHYQINNQSLPLIDRRPLDQLIKGYFDGMPNGGVGNVFIKLVLPRSEAYELAHLLKEFGYGHAKIFPGYEGVALEMKTRLIEKN